MKKTKNKQKSVFWAQKVSDLYEKVTQNNAFSEKMDLHNNAVGRFYFLSLLGKNEQEMIDFTIEKMKNAQKVTKIEETKRFYNQMIFIEE